MQRRTTVSVAVFGSVALLVGAACSGEEPKQEGELPDMVTAGKGGSGGSGHVIGVTGGGGAGGTAGSSGQGGSGGARAGAAGEGAGSGSGGTGGTPAGGGMSGSGGCTPLEPDPTGNSETCPVAEPSLGDACSVEQELECRYYQPVDDPCVRRPFVSFIYTCCSGTWLGDCPDLAEGQDPSCPEALPVPGADCAAADLTCSYENPTLLGTEQYGSTCCSGKWHRCEPYIGPPSACACP